MKSNNMEASPSSSTTSSSALISSPSPSFTAATSQAPAYSSSSSPAAVERLISDSSPEESCLSRENGQESIYVERRGDHSAVCRWAVFNFHKVKAKSLWSRYFEVGGYDCRLLVYPKGDSQALPGYFSIYLQIMDPRGSSSSKWDCFASYRLSIFNHLDESKSIQRDSWHRFSSKKKSHGWCDFTPSSTVLDPKAGFLLNDSVLITGDILILNESVSFNRDNELQASMMPVPDVLSGKFTWKVHNFSLFKEMIKTQKIMSPVFPAGECNLRISVYQSSVNGIDYLSMCLESKDTEKSVVPDRSCWCLFRMSVLNQRQGLNHIHRDSYGRFAADNKSGDNTSLGWNDYMKMSDFLGHDSGFLIDDTAIFTTSFHVIKESSSFSKNVSSIGRNGGARKSDGHLGKFTWRIENFTKLKDLLKKRKITGLCVKSRRFQIGNRDCRLIVYPRGQSQPPCHLSVFLEVTDSRSATSDWSCFVSHRLSIINQKTEEKSVTKESQNRYSKAAKDWGWREFVTLTSLFDQDSGFLVQDTVVFSAEVLILKEASTMVDFSSQESTKMSSLVNGGKRVSFTWKVENFYSFKEIMETRKIFSKFFQAGGCELRIGVYESFDTICIYLESDQSAGSDPDKNFWVKYRMAIVNQKNPSKTVWKESSICTKTWNNSVLQFMKVSDMLEVDAGYLVRDTVVFICEIIDCCPWFEFQDMDVWLSDEEPDEISTDPDELADSEDSDTISGDEEDIFRNLLSRAGFHLTYEDNTSEPHVSFREKLLMDAGSIAGFLTGLRVYLDDPSKIKRLLLPTKIFGNSSVKKEVTRDATSPSLMNLLMGVKVLQQAIIDLLLDIMVECCHPSEGRSRDNSSDTGLMSSNEDVIPVEPCERSEEESSYSGTLHRLGSGLEESASEDAIQSSDMNKITSLKTIPVQPTYSPTTCAGTAPVDVGNIRTPRNKWPEQAEELLGLIVNSLRALDGAVPQGCPEPRRRPHSSRKISLVLDKAPKHLQSDLISLVPKLVDPLEHHLAAYILLDRLHKPDVEPVLQLPILDALNQLELSCEMWETVLPQALYLLSNSNGQLLAKAVNFVFNVAFECHQLSEAVKAVRSRMNNLGLDVPSCVMDNLCKIVKTRADVGDTFLSHIDADCQMDDNFMEPCGLVADNIATGERFQVSRDCTILKSCHLCDIYILIEMLSIPSLVLKTSQVFERAVVRGIIAGSSVVKVLERRIRMKNQSNNEDVLENKDTSKELSSRDDFITLLNLVESLALLRNTRVQEFVKTLYVALLGLYSDKGCRKKILKAIVDRTINTTENCHDVEIDLEILVMLINEEEGLTKPILNMMREVAELANVDRAALWHQLCASEEENLRIREERQTEISNAAREKAILNKKLSESEAIVNRLKSEMKAEAERSLREKKELSEQMQEIENQLEWVRSEWNEETKKLSAEKKVLQEQLHDVETQLLQLKSRKRDELKKLMKEKNTLAERLRNAEAARKRFDEELKRYATETMTREEVRQSLEDEVRRLTQTVGQTEGEKREKEEQVARCEAYIDGMESKIRACQQYIQNLENSLREEMDRHAPLYGAGLEALSMSELETLSRIHEDGLRQIRLLQQCKGSGNPLVGVHSIPQSHGFYPTTATPLTIGLPPIIPNGVGAHCNGHINSSGLVGPWFNPT